MLHQDHAQFRRVIRLLAGQGFAVDAAPRAHTKTLPPVPSTALNHFTPMPIYGGSIHEGPFRLCQPRWCHRPAGDQRPAGSQAATHRTWLRAGGFEASDDPFLYDDSFLHDRVSRTDPYGCCAGFSTLNTAPCGSVKTADRPTDGMSNGSTMTCPPPSAALVAVASVSSTAK